MYLLLLALAVLPALVLAVFIYFKDKYEHEPIGMLLLTFVCGAVTVLPAILMEGGMALLIPDAPFWGATYTAFTAGFCEELVKLGMLMILIWRNKNFDEYFDGIVYAAYVSLGFACVENIAYVLGGDGFGESMTTAIMRALVSVPGHFLFAVVMGYHFALAKFDRPHRGGHLFLAFLLPMLMHTVFDALLMVNEALGEDFWFLSLIILGAFIWFDIKMWKWGMRRIRRLQEYSKQQNFDRENPFDGFNWNV